MEGVPTVKAKVVTPYSSSKILNSPSPRPTSRRNAENIPSRPASPTKPFVTTNSNIDSSLAFRPRAKVNSSATTRNLKVATVKASTSTSSTPRSRSPTKIPPRVRNGITSPTHTPKSPSYGSSGALRPPTVASAPVTPERTASLTTASTTASSSVAPEDAGNSRMGTFPSLHHAVSFSSLQPTLNYSASPRPGTISVTSSPRLIPLAGLDRETTGSPTPRFRSKVSTVAKAADFSAVSAPGFPPSSTHPSTRSLNIRTRTPSVSSTLSQWQSQETSPPLQVYPITTATVAGNPHRYAPARPPSRTILPAASQVFQSIAPKPVTPADASPPSQNRIGVKVDDIQAKASPSSISAPPLSPPMSALSFSSRSSVSRSSASVSAVGDCPRSQSTSTASSHLSPSVTMRNGTVDLNATLDSLMEYTSGLPSATESAGDTEDEVEDEERTVKAAAKSNRKIADLEITNRSLLAINATLEATKHRQAKEIRELKRKLRESRLILPPRAYQEVSSLEPLEVADDEEDAEDEEEVEDEKDEIYHRINLLIDNLLNTGKRALEKQINDFPEGAKGGAKVLTAEEVRDWHQGTGSGSELSDHDHDNTHDEHSAHHERVLEPRDGNTSLDGDNSFTATEAEVEAMTLTSSISASTPPPIFITKPSQSCLSYS